MQERAGSAALGCLRSSSERSSSSAFQLDVKEDIGAESDEEEISRVPQICGNSVSAVGISASGKAPASDSIRTRGRSAAEKESKRLKRLLRNRVSAQQARERKKAYLSELERRATNLEKRNSELEEKLSTLQNENQMLRHVRQTNPVDITFSFRHHHYVFHHKYTSIGLFSNLSSIFTDFLCICFFFSFPFWTDFYIWVKEQSHIYCFLKEKE